MNDDNFISVSRINCYKQCPYRYKLQYVDEIPIIIKSEALTLGSTIHELLEQNIFEHEDEKFNPYLVNAYELLKTINDIETLDSVSTNELKLYGEVLGNKTVGIIDKVWKDQGIALDWKTGNLKSGWDQQKRKKVMYSQEDYCLQSYFYKELYNQNHDNKLDKFYFAFLGNKEIWTPKIKGNKFGTVGFDLWCENEIVETLECINSCLFDKNETVLCSYCDYRYVCDLDI